jgi:hypothetical protein
MKVLLAEIAIVIAFGIVAAVVGPVALAQPFTSLDDGNISQRLRQNTPAAAQNMTGGNMSVGNMTTG